MTVHNQMQLSLAQDMDSKEILVASPSFVHTQESDRWDQYVWPHTCPAIQCSVATCGCHSSLEYVCASRSEQQEGWNPTCSLEAGATLMRAKAVYVRPRRGCSPQQNEGEQLSKQIQTFGPFCAYWVNCTFGGSLNALIPEVTQS